MRPTTRLLAPLLAITALATPALAQQTQPNHPTSTPYTGNLGIFDYPQRDAELQPERILTLLGVHPGSAVADLGAGGGWMTVRAAKRVGPSGTVYAEDINKNAINTIETGAHQQNLQQIHTILGAPDNPKLPPQSVNAVIMLDMYHEIADSSAFLHNLAPALKPGAKLGIIDRNGTGANHGLNEAQVVRELAKAGFQRVGRYDFVKPDREDYFLIFEHKNQQKPN